MFGPLGTKRKASRHKRLVGKYVCAERNQLRGQASQAGNTGSNPYGAQATDTVPDAESPPGSMMTHMLAHLKQDRRYAAMLGLGFSMGVPYLLVYATQSAWLSEAKVPIETIGLLSELTFAYKLKWVWSPFLDRYDPPFFAATLGRRRAWIVVSQLCVMITARRRRLRRSRALADLDDCLFAGAWHCRRDAGHLR